MNKVSISDNALMAIAEFTKVLTAYVILKQTSRERRWFGGRRSTSLIVVKQNQSSSCFLAHKMSRQPSTS